MRRPAALRTLRYRSLSTQPLRVGIVGSGPAAFYTAKYILKEAPHASVDMFERLPTPFGLVRYGVAPDHPEVKSVQNDFSLVLKDPRCRFFGNVHVGTDVPLAELKKHYNAVVLAYGAGGDRWLDIPGKGLQNVCSARSFVNWYNGHPDYAKMSFDLSCETAVIIGQGNVAIDVARILSTPVDALRQTDMSSRALDALASSRIRRVHVVGRRGAVQAAFTIKELRELTTLPNCAVRILQAELDAGLTPASQEELKARPRKRKWDLITDIVAKAPAQQADKEISLRFLLNPRQFLPDSQRPERVGGVEFERTRLDGPAEKQQAVGTGEMVKLDAGIVFQSIGYKSVAMEGVPFDARRAVVPNIAGRVLGNEASSVEAGLYVSGWLKRGPTGIIAANIGDAKETVSSLIEDSTAGRLPPAASEDVSSTLKRLTTKAGTPLPVSAEQWDRIDQEEQRQGAEKGGKLREKLLDVEEMLRVARK